ncbi:MAG: dihydrofolate reductase family protein [Hyphomicrobium sp.]
MGSVRFYVATSLDGFIADREGGVDWMAPYDARLYGYDVFVAEIGALVMGRRTYELVHAVGEWPYEDKRVYVISSHKLEDPPHGVVLASNGIAGALKSARKETTADIWIVGGAVTMQSALEENLVDVMEIFLVPVLLGTGLTLLNELKRNQTLTFDGIEAFPDGVVKLRYFTAHYRATGGYET